MVDFMRGGFKFPVCVWECGHMQAKKKKKNPHTARLLPGETRELGATVPFFMSSKHTCRFIRAYLFYKACEVKKYKRLLGFSGSSPSLDIEQVQRYIRFRNTLNPYKYIIQWRLEVQFIHAIFSVLPPKYNIRRSSGKKKNIIMANKWGCLLSQFPFL